MVAVPKALSILTVSQSPWSPFAASLVLEHALSVKAAVSPMATVKLHRRLTGLAVGSVIFLLAGCCMQPRSEEHTSELQSRFDLVCRLLLEKKKTKSH